MKIVTAAQKIDNLHFHSPSSKQAARKLADLLGLGGLLI